MRFSSCFCINRIKGGFPVNMDLGNSVYLFLSIQKSVNWKFLFQLFFFFFKTQRLCIASFHKEHKPIWGQLVVLHFLLGSTGLHCELANPQTRLRAAQTGCDLAWTWQSRTEPGLQALYQQLAPWGGRPAGRSSRGWGPCGLEAAEGASEKGGSRTEVRGSALPPFFVLI